MSAHAKVYIHVQSTGDASMNNWIPYAIEAIDEWLTNQGFDTNAPGVYKGSGPHKKTYKENYWIEVESTSASYDVFDRDYISHTLNSWVEEHKQLRFEYSVYNLDIEPDIFMTREDVGGRPVGYDSRGD